ncbi:hypothetical protein KR093_010555 [Drosophila rubida]|uniref:Uncharacterized protein n=1 Tax=Drosophila rubida TaxID=30044 RepID=A0AAD4JXH2_9MUSC|nr:hypothetical protein KR093_010555 [Drosophila rubida]
MSALGLLLLVGAQGTTIISIKYPPQGTEPRSTLDQAPQQQPAKRDLSLSYAATNIDSKEGTRVKTITVIKNVGGVGVADVAGSSSAATSNRQVKLAINPELHKNEEWANAFRDNFESYGRLPDVPDIDDLFDFVNRKQPEKDVKEKETKSKEKPTESTTKKATSEHAEDADDSDEAIVEKIKGDAELLPHIKQANILRLQAQELRQKHQQQQQQQQQQQSQQLQQQPELEQSKRSLVNVNYSTPMHSVSQFFENYVQVLPNGYDYTKPEPEQPPQPCGAAGAVPVPPNNSIQVTTPSGRSYDIPQSNSSGINGGINHPYLAPALAKRTQIQPAPQQPQPSQLPPSYSTVNSIVPPIVQGSNLPTQSQPPPQQQPQQPQAPSVAVAGGSGVFTSQRPYVAPSLRNNGLGINRGPSTPQPLPLPGNINSNNFNNNNNNALPSYRLNNFGGNRPNIFRSRGLKY